MQACGLAIQKHNKWFLCVERRTQIARNQEPLQKLAMFALLPKARLLQELVVDLLEQAAVNLDVPFGDGGAVRHRPKAQTITRIGDGEARGRISLEFWSLSLLRPIGFIIFAGISSLRGACAIHRHFWLGPLLGIQRHLHSLFAVEFPGIARQRAVQDHRLVGISRDKGDRLQIPAVLDACQGKFDTPDPARRRHRNGQVIHTGANHHCGKVALSQPAQRPTQFAHQHSEFRLIEAARHAHARDRNCAAVFGCGRARVLQVEELCEVAPQDAALGVLREQAFPRPHAAATVVGRLEMQRFRYRAIQVANYIAGKCPLIVAHSQRVNFSGCSVVEWFIKLQIIQFQEVTHNHLQTNGGRCKGDNRGRHAFLLRCPKQREHNRFLGLTLALGNLPARLSSGKPPQRARASLLCLIVAYAQHIARRLIEQREAIYCVLVLARQWRALE